MARKITVYQGIVKTLCAEGIILEKDRVLPELKSELVTDQALFIKFRNVFESLDYGNILFSYEEAYDCVLDEVNRRESIIQSLFRNPNTKPEERDAYLKYLEGVTKCLYMEYNGIYPVFSVEKSSLKQLKKHRQDNISSILEKGNQ